MRFRCTLAAALGCLAVAAPLAAQRYTQLSGAILDPSEAAVPGASVTAVNQDTGFRRFAQSQPDGAYRFPSLEPGIYKITVRKEGFRTVVRFGVRLDALRPARLDFNLPVGSIEETITVEGTAPLLDAGEVSPGTVIARNEIERLPANGRGLLALLDLSPGALVTPATRGESGQFTVNGQRPNTHYFLVDGVSANTGVSAGGVPAQPTGGTLPAMSAFGSLQTLISLEDLQEFRVQSFTAGPEFGRLPGATVTLTSRSGSNQLHGSAVYSFRHELLAANDWFANRYGERRAPLRMRDFAASLGGPVRRDRTFFFLSYERMTLRQPFAWRAAVPDAEVRQAAPEWAAPLLDLFPAANGRALGANLAEWSGRNHRPSHLDTGSVRIDHAVTSGITAFARYNQAPSSSEFGAAQVNRLDLRWASITTGLNLRPRPDMVVDVRLNASRARAQSSWIRGGEPLAPCALEAAIVEIMKVTGRCNDVVRLSIAGVGSVVSGSEGRRMQGQFQIPLTVSLTRGAHSIRLGADYRRLTPHRRDAAGTISIMAETLDDLVSNHNLWVASSEPQNADARLEELSLSVQDTWQVTPRLTAAYGVRWDLNPAPNPGQPAYYLDPERGYVMPFERPIWPANYDSFGPRLGLAYRPASRTVLRAGAGLYFDSSLSIATDLVNGGPFNVWQHKSPRHAPFSTMLTYGFDPNLRMPFVKQWSISAEHAIGDRDVLSAAYVGSAGRRLIRREIGGPGSSEVSWVALATNHAGSDYQGFQAHYRRTFSRGVQAQFSYTWSHSIDDSSSDSGLYWVAGASTRARDRGSSDFDVRHVLSGAFSWDVYKGWALDGALRARTGFPIDVLSTDQYMGVEFSNVFRPDLVGGVPVWVADGSAPGGRRLNSAAFRVLPTPAQGTLGRNVISGFGMLQVDLALRREFRLRGERVLELRAEAFNALNRPNFGDPVKLLVNPLFGQSSSMLNLMLGTGSPGSGLAPIFQTGGARSVQLMLRLRF
jgi:hypothetical protein